MYAKAQLCIVLHAEVPHLLYGQVLVEGCDVKDMDLQCLRNRVGLVSQEPVLFSCSVRENICYGNPDASQQQIEDAARAANAHSFIQRLPEGYSTQVHPLHLMPPSQSALCLHAGEAH